MSLPEDEMGHNVVNL